MSLQAWLRDLTDDTLSEWASRGLLRRAQKLLEGQDSVEWQLEGEQAAVSLDGHRQQLAGVGFERLSCSCPAFGICHHQVALLLGLRTHLLEVAEAAVPAVAPAEPWRVEIDELPGLLGRAAMNRAQRWLAQGLAAELRIDERELRAEMEVPARFEVMIPRSGGLPASLCSCRESRCAHRALVLLQVAGVQVSEDAPAEALDHRQQQALASLDAWLQELAVLGLNGGSSLFLARGEALATELVQADLPLPGRLLTRVVGCLGAERAGMTGSSARELREQLAPLIAHRRALARVPLPQPLPQLAGVHRRRFHPVGELELLCVAAQCWETRSDFIGYSLHFLSLRDGRHYSMSESRARALNPQWSPRQALLQAEFGGQRAASLVGRHCLLEKGWASEDGRLSSREGTRLRVGEALCAAVMGQLQRSPAQRVRQIVEHRLHWLYRADPQGWGLVGARVVRMPVFERLRQGWEGLAESEDGVEFALRLEDLPDSRRAVRLLQAAAGAGTLWLFGHWSIDGNRLQLLPVACLDGQVVTQLFCEMS